MAEQALRRSGIIDTKADRYAEMNRKPLAAHIEDWKQSLVAKGNTKDHVSLVRARAETLVTMVKAERISDLMASAVQEVIGELHKTGTSLQTCQHYLRAIKQFSRWLHRDGRSREDALAHLTGYNAETDRKYVRRPLDADELTRLIQTAENGPYYQKMTGPDRAMRDRTASGTGFRASELRSLTPESFDLDAQPPAVTVQAGVSKRRRVDRQPIRHDLAELLRPMLDDIPDGAPVFTMPKYTAPMIRVDLRRARCRWILEARTPVERRRRRDSDFLAVVDHAGHVADFHSLRVSYVTALVKGGASVKVCQELARHSTPTLTLNTYTKLGIHDLTGALDALLPVAPTEARPHALAATGTDDKTPTGAITSSVTHGSAKPGIPEATRCDEPDRNVQTIHSISEAPKPSYETELREMVQDDATGKRRGRDSNPRCSLIAACRFSKPVPSATQPPLHQNVAYAVTLYSILYYLTRSIPAYCRILFSVFSHPARKIKLMGKPQNHIRVRQPADGR